MGVTRCSFIKLFRMALAGDIERIKAVHADYCNDGGLLEPARYKCAVLALSGYKPSKAMVRALRSAISSSNQN